MNASTEGLNPSAPRGRLIAAFAAIYLIWGSTYLGIRIAVETLPPLMMGGARFFTAGLVLYTWLRLGADKAPTLNGWRQALIASILLLGLGNGGVNWAERKVASGSAALIIAGTPVWFALFDWLRPGGKRPSGQTLLGIIVGFAGVMLLIGNRSNSAIVAPNFSGVIALLCASMAWAMGSLFTKYTERAESPMMFAAQQMISGGVIMLLGGFLLGEGANFNLHAVSGRSWIAFVYLTLVGSLVGFSAYAWLLKATTPAKASTYAYVNPVIAVFLGWFLGGETLTSQMLVAAGVIVLGVIIITVRWERKEEPAMKDPIQADPSVIKS